MEYARDPGSRPPEPQDHREEHPTGNGAGGLEPPQGKKGKEEERRTRAAMNPRKDKEKEEGKENENERGWS